MILDSCNNQRMLDGLLRDLAAVRPPLMSVRTTALLVAPVWIGFLGGAASGRPADGLLVALGGYIVLFGNGQPVRQRLPIQLFAAAGLLASVAFGMLVGGSVWWTLLAYVATSAAMALFAARLFDPGPPGPYFFVLMVGGGTLLTPLGGIGRVEPVIAVGCTLALAFSLLDSRIERYAARPATPAHLETGALLRLARLLAALALGVAISGWRGDRHPFWVVLVVVLILSVPGDGRTLTVRAVGRLLGTLIGIALFIPISGAHFGTWGFTAWLCLLVWPMARMTSRNYLLGSVVITVFALSLTVPLAPAQPPLLLAADRALDTLVAASLAMLSLWAIRPRSRRS